jgi:hypothetical protein
MVAPTPIESLSETNCLATAACWPRKLIVEPAAAVLDTLLIKNTTSAARRKSRTIIISSSRLRPRRSTLLMPIRAISCIGNTGP